MTDADIERVARKLCAKEGRDPDSEVMLYVPYSYGSPLGMAFSIDRSRLMPAWRLWRRTAVSVLEEVEAK